jgi:hypothetical protein
MVVAGTVVRGTWYVVRDEESRAIRVVPVAFNPPADWPAQANATTPSASPPKSTTTTRKGEDTRRG